MKLVLVHGRSQENKDPRKLEKEWLDALHYGLARADLRLPASTVVAFPYFGDLLVKLVAETAVPLGPQVNFRGINPDAEPELRGKILAEIAAGAGITEADIVRELGARPIERGPGNWEWVQAVLRAVDRVPGLNSEFVDAFARDVYVYLTYPGVRAKIDMVVSDSIGSEPCVVVSHSLGTIISYNVLYGRTARVLVPRFITLGSPLGIRGIQRHVEQPLRSPPCVGHWFNAFDERDLVALRPLDHHNFGVTPPIENWGQVVNFTDNRHGIAGYLADRRVAERLVELLTP